MNTPKLKIELNKGQHGVELEKLATIARDTAKFLTSLSVDLGDPEAEWIADNFKSGSVCFEVQSRREIKSEPQMWRNAMHAVMANDFSDDILNVRIRPETRARFFDISKALPEGDSAAFGICENGDESNVEWHRLDKQFASEASTAVAPKNNSHGEIQGIVHAFFKETKSPKLVIRELSTRNLIDCFFDETMYQHAVELLRDKDGVIFVEGTASETETGEISEIHVSDFTPAPEFFEGVFESMIGTFPKALSGEKDAAEALDEFRT
jgi:hypothetical protein